jgi:hypothetical protein
VSRQTDLSEGIQMIFLSRKRDRNKDADEIHAARWIPDKVKQQSRF